MIHVSSIWNLLFVVVGEGFGKVTVSLICLIRFLTRLLWVNRGPCAWNQCNDRSIINKRKNNAHAKIAREVINEKDSQLEAAVEWCLSNNKRGWAALKTNDFPLLKDARAINRRLDGLVTNKAEYESRSILTNNEEQTLVGYMKNMNRCNQGVSRSDTTVVILKMLEIRKWGVRKYGARRYNPLSKAANDALENKNVSRAFWRRFDSKHPDLTQ